MIYLKKFKLYIVNEDFSIKDSFNNLKNLEEIEFSAWHPKNILEILKLNKEKFKTLKIGTGDINKYPKLKKDINTISNNFPNLIIYKSVYGEWEKYMG